MDSVPGQTFLNYAYSWGASVVILGTLFKLTHLPGANVMLFIGMGTEVVVFFLSAFDRPFDKTTIGMDLAVHMDDEDGEEPQTEQVSNEPQSSAAVQQPIVPQPSVSSGDIQWLQQQQELTPELEEATTNYIDELKNLTEMLAKVSEQSQKLTRDSEEMENLNRTLTGITRVYEMQLKGVSAQIGTIDQINEQSRRMAEQISELNNIYARMIQAMTINAKV